MQVQSHRDPWASVRKDIPSMQYAQRRRALLRSDSLHQTFRCLLSHSQGPLDFATDVSHSLDFALWLAR